MPSYCKRSYVWLQQWRWRWAELASQEGQFPRCWEGGFHCYIGPKSSFCDAETHSQVVWAWEQAQGIEQQERYAIQVADFNVIFFRNMHNILQNSSIIHWSFYKFLLRLLEKVTEHTKKMVTLEEQINTKYSSGVVNGFNKTKLCWNLSLSVIVKHYFPIIGGSIQKNQTWTLRNQKDLRNDLNSAKQMLGPQFDFTIYFFQ